MTPTWGWRLDEQRRRAARRRALRRMVVAWFAIVAGGIVLALAIIGFMALTIVTLG